MTTNSPINFIETDDDEIEIVSDVWAADEYGYTDANFLGTETWEDQKGMDELKARMEIPFNWFLVKVVNFDEKKLKNMEKWLDENCVSEYKRAGFRSNCSTKVFVAFESQDDAIYYKLRWR